MLVGESSKLYQKLYDENVIDADFSVDYERMRGMALLELSGDSEDPRRILREVLAEAAAQEADPAEGMYPQMEAPEQLPWRKLRFRWPKHL